LLLLGIVAELEVVLLLLGIVAELEVVLLQFGIVEDEVDIVGQELATGCVW
jgi:hypothetical protein